MGQVSRSTKRRQSKPAYHRYIVKEEIAAIKARNSNIPYKKAFAQASRAWYFSLVNLKNQKVIRKSKLRRREIIRSKIKNISKNDRSKKQGKIQMFDEKFEYSDLDDLDVEMSEMSDDIDIDIDEEMVDADDDNCEAEKKDEDDVNKTEINKMNHTQGDINEVNHTSQSEINKMNHTSQDELEISKLNQMAEYEGGTISITGPNEGGRSSDTKDKEVKYDFICDCCKSKFQIQILFSHN
ncbi:hypothetical protein RclHR1_04010001 [Rhizophagus clarus]|nr:hypothetical protein RclHR1_04010001 [Rhizophagus clarus]